MANKNEINTWLKENNYTWEDMDKIWEECCKINTKCKLMKESGKNWSDLNIFLIKGLPDVSDLARKRLEKENLEKKKKEELEYQKRYYEEHFEDIIVNKIMSGEKLTETELQRIVSDYSYDTIPGSKHRWTQTVRTICIIKDRYFSVDWEEALTENQCNSFMNQPYEVYPRERMKVIKTTHYFTDASVKKLCRRII